MFFQDATFLFLAALIIAIAIEKVDLHRHLALTILFYVGQQPTRYSLCSSYAHICSVMPYLHMHVAVDGKLEMENRYMYLVV